MTSDASGNPDTAPEETSEFTADERAAMKERAQELKSVKRRGGRADPAAQEAAVLAKIAELPEADRVVAERFHAIVTSSAPILTPRLWYGMPAYARDGEVVCFFQSAAKFKTRYCTIGFSDAAALDDGFMWSTSYAVAGMNAAVEAQLTELVVRATGAKAGRRSP